MCISRDEPEYASVMQALARNRVEVKESALFHECMDLYSQVGEMLFDKDSCECFILQENFFK